MHMSSAALLHPQAEMFATIFGLQIVIGSFASQMRDPVFSSSTRHP
jgi:hypothetical protein